MATPCQGKLTVRRYHLTKEITFIKLRVPKEQAGHIQFLLEGNDNLFMCSTKPKENDPQFRHLELCAPIEWSDELRRFINELGKRIPVLITEDRIIIDD